MPTHQPLPDWLLDATSSPLYINEAWELLETREQQRAVARSAFRPHKGQRKSAANGAPEPYILDYYSVSTGISPDNRFFNRYSDVLPYDRNRVIPPGADERYLNASWIQTKASGQWFIAAQAPLVWTANSFLTLATAGNKMPTGGTCHRVRTIVQLTPEFERKFRKADPYFPSEIGHVWTLQSEDEKDLHALEVKLVKQTRMEDTNCIRSDLVVHLTKSKTNTQDFPVIHLLYTSWPDHGVPEDTDSLLRFVRYAEEVNSEGDSSLQSPIIVGCSAGIGRTGTFIAISSLLKVGHEGNCTAESGVSEQPVSPIKVPELGTYSKDLVVAEIDWLREQRGGMVQKREQMELIYGILRTA